MFDEMIGWERMLEAWRLAAKGKRYKTDVLCFGQRWEEELIELQHLLLWDEWRPRPMRRFTVHRPKTRLIEAPDFRDRIVHHLLSLACEPLFERRFVAHSFACRKGRGTHAARAHVVAMLRQAQRRWGRVYVLQCDVRQFFPSIDHEMLLCRIGRVVQDERVMQIWRRAILRDDQATGLPIGALTSQMSGNVYLDPLDHWIKDDLGCPYYARYMDDFLILGPHKGRLQELRTAIAQRLANADRLMLHPKSQVYPASQGVDFCGYRSWASHALPRKRNLVAARKRLRRLAQRHAAGEIGPERLEASLASFEGYTKHCDGARTTASILAEVEETLGQPLHQALNRKEAA
ncbi:reverse transcriptase/maturase family protein [Fodinicurvata sediminis]|uniref:reverse transcriptase/maturase family protein n=1 Tax=Fodinicurvata sediminis TaxID=1121832 RepID=UPI0004069F56|nr:reverse transcriptase/maturase family protein [Fodinicurvata sediminis]